MTVYKSSKINSIRTGKPPKKVVKKTNPSFAPTKGKKTVGGGMLESKRH